MSTIPAGTAKARRAGQWQQQRRQEGDESGSRVLVRKPMQQWGLERGMGVALILRDVERVTKRAGPRCADPEDESGKTTWRHWGRIDSGCRRSQLRHVASLTWHIMSIVTSRPCALPQS